MPKVKSYVSAYSVETFLYEKGRSGRRPADIGGKDAGAAIAPWDSPRCSGSRRTPCVRGPA